MNQGHDIHNLSPSGSANCDALGILPALLACWFPVAKSRLIYAIVDEWGSIVLQDANKSGILLMNQWLLLV